jgi:hypothetical protein
MVLIMGVFLMRRLFFFLIILAQFYLRGLFSEELDQKMSTMEDPYVLDLSTSEPLEYEDPASSDTYSGKSWDDHWGEGGSKKDRSFINTGFSIFPIYKKVDYGTSAGGLDLTYYFRRHSEHPMSVPCYIRTSLMAGQNQYVSLKFAFNNYWDNEKHNIYTSISYGRRFATYYQLYSNAPSTLGTYLAADTKWNIIYRKKIFWDIYLGAKYEVEHNDMSGRVPLNVFENGAVPGLNGSTASGIGVIFGNLPHEDVFSPRSKFAFEFSNMFYLEALGSTTDFGKHILDLREYLALFKGHTLALQLYMKFLSGTPTYRQLSSLGDIFQAYFHDRYLDDHVMGFRGEYRVKLVDVFYLTTFLGIGYHSKYISKFSIKDYYPSYGAGSRFLLNKELNIYARLDYFAGRGTNGLMFGIGDEF